MSKDGSAPFGATDQPGDDSGPSNGIVRTNDIITYDVNVNVVGGTAENETFTLTAPEGTEWLQLPTECTGGGSRINGRQLICNLGSLTNQSQVVQPSLRVTGAKQNGDTVQVTGTVTADNATTPNVPAPNPPITRVSAAPRFDLVKDRFEHRSVAAAAPDGTSGRVFYYPIAIENTPRDPSIPHRLGAEQLRSPLSFTDDISQILEGVASPDARLYTWGKDGPGCWLPSYEKFGAGDQPGGAGGGPAFVTDSGAVSCAQSASGANIDVTLTGTDTSATHVPSRALWNSLPAGNGYVASIMLAIWIPDTDLRAAADATGGVVRMKDTLTGFSPTSTSGQTNVDPPANNSYQMSNKLSMGLGYDKNFVLTDNDRYYAPGSQVLAYVIARNQGLGVVDPQIACDVFDKTQMTIVAARADPEPAGTKVQYAAQPTRQTPQQMATQTCGDTDGPWYDGITAVPGGAAAVGRVRVVGPVAGQSARYLNMEFRIRDDARLDDRVRNYGAYQDANTNNGNWTLTGSNPDLADCCLADYLLLSPVLARIVKKTVDPGTNASTTQNKDQIVTAGTTAKFALYPSLTSGGKPPGPQDVTVVDTLPKYLQYVSGSATREPSSVVENPDGTTTITWVYPQTVPGTSIAPITFEVRADPAAPAGDLVNKAVIGTPLDTSAEKERTAQRQLTVVEGKGLIVSKRVVKPTVIIGDRMEYTLTADNRTSSALSTIDIIDVLPHRGDNRNPASGFTGRAELAAAPTPTPAGGTLRYTKAAPNGISLNPNAASNGPGGTSTWCVEADFGTTGCPTGLAEATAFRYDKPGPIAPSAGVSLGISLRNTDQAAGDVYTNRAGAAAPEIALPVESPDVPVRVVAGCAGDFVWLDEKRTGVQSGNDPAVPDVTVTLTGTDDLGGQVRRTTKTGKDGKYRFGNLRPGTYTATFTQPIGYTFTTKNAGTDPASNSVAGSNGAGDPFTLNKDTTDSGALIGVNCDLNQDAGLIRQHQPTPPTPGPSPPTPSPSPPTPTPTPPTPTPTPPTPTTSVPPSDPVLPETGPNTVWPGLLAAGMIIAGIAIFLVARRRRDT
ncbi:SdrD B-like domain-containing protein [Actinorhabdospora filicis]|uniref:SdrD B-like domain-containing protein n=1 Tax=Actinorhabdospora filicis TaxID=1785913 RepID=UPI0025527CC2|nr:SdrD B-like domain-containing protein [Actinorhabdospora filicis]